MSATVYRETLRRLFTSPAFLLGGLAIVIAAALIGGNDGPADFWQTFLSLAAIIAGAQLIGPEFASGTLQLILAKPVNRSAYLLARWAGVVTALIAVAATCLAVDAGGRMIAVTTQTDWTALLSSTASRVLVLVLICALMALYGSFTRGYANVAIYLIAQLFLTLADATVRGFMRNGRSDSVMGEFLRAHPGVLRGIRAVYNNLYPSAPKTWQWQFALLIATNVTVALLAACLFFRRREVPYGAD